MILKELFAKLGLDIDEVGFDKADTLIGGLKNGLLAVGSIASTAAAGLGAMVLQVADAAGDLDDLSQQTGVSTDALQELGFAAKFGGIEMEGLTTGLIFLTKNLAAAKGGSKEAAEAFAGVGIAVTETDGALRPAEDVLTDLAEHFAELPDGADKTALAMQFFGKSGASMIPLLNAGAEGLEEFRRQARDLGVVLDENTIKTGAQVGDALDTVHFALAGLRNVIAGPLLPAARDLGKTFVDWIKANRELIRQRVDKIVMMLKVAVQAALVVLDTMWKILGFIIDNWKLLAAILNSVVLAALLLNFTAISTSINGYIAMGRAAIGAAVRSAAAWVAATWPLLLLTGIIALVILLLEDVITALDGGDSVLGKWLGDDWIKTLRGWREAFKNFWEWLTESSAKTWKDMKRGFDRVFGTATSDDSSAANGFDTDKDKGAGVWKRNKEGVLKFYPWLDEAGQANEVPEGGDTGFKDDKGRGPGKWKRLQNGLLRFFPDEQFDPTVNFGSAGTPGGGATPPATGDKHASFNVQQTIYGASGQSPGEVAGEAVNQLDAWHQRQLDAAYMTG